MTPVAGEKSTRLVIQINQTDGEGGRGRRCSSFVTERRTGTPRTLVRFPGAARDPPSPPPQSTCSADSLTVSVHPHVQSHALTSKHTFKIP